jgi:hypothetical protein
MKLSAMKIDPALSEQDDWAENIPDLPGIRIKARVTNNGDYRAPEAKLVQEIPRVERIEGESPKEQDRIWSCHSDEVTCGLMQYRPQVSSLWNQALTC